MLYLLVLSTYGLPLPFTSVFCRPIHLLPLLILPWFGPFLELIYAHWHVVYILAAAYVHCLRKPDLLCRKYPILAMRDGSGSWRGILDLDKYYV